MRCLVFQNVALGFLRSHQNGAPTGTVSSSAGLSFIAHHATGGVVSDAADRRPGTAPQLRQTVQTKIIDTSCLTQMYKLREPH